MIQIWYCSISSIYEDFRVDGMLDIYSSHKWDYVCLSHLQIWAFFEFCHEIVFVIQKYIQSEVKMLFLMNFYLFIKNMDYSQRTATFKASFAFTDKFSIFINKKVFIIQPNNLAIIMNDSLIFFVTVLPID